MDPGEADAAKKPQGQREDEPVRKGGECQAGSRAEQCTADIEPATIHAIGGAGQKRDRNGIAGKIDAPDPAGLAAIERPGGGNLMQCRRECHAIAVPFLASATDRMDGRWLYVGSALLGAAASLAFAAFAHGFVLALTLRLLGGIGLAGVHMPGLNLLMDRVDRSHQGRAVGIYTSIYAAGSAVSFMIAGVVDAAFGWRASFIAAGMGPLLSIGACALLPRLLSQTKSDRPQPPYRASFAIVRWSPTWRLLRATPGKSLSYGSGLS